MSALPVMVKREFWEHRALWVTPLAIAVVLVLGTAFFGQFRLDIVGGPPPGTRSEPGQPLALFELALLGVSVPFYIAAGILASVYLLDCLYAERRDRSILFWKSLPVSDAATVLVKFIVGLVIVPLGAFTASAVTSVLIAGLLGLRNHAVGIVGVPIWDTVSWLRTQGVMLYGLIAALFWYAPYAAYLMLASAWARRSVYAWAFIPPILLALLERMLFGTNFVGGIVQRGFGEVMHLAFRLNRQIDINVGDVIGPPRGGVGRRLVQPLDPSALLSSPQLWLGLAAAALMIWGAVRLRRYRDDS